MHTRQMRRAIERAARKTRKLTPQPCVLWVQAARSYVAGFGPDRYHLVDDASLAQRFCDDGAATAALTFFELFKVRAAVRRYQPMAQSRGEHHAHPEASSVAGRP